jgi:hypothetical protein
MPHGRKRRNARVGLPARAALVALAMIGVAALAGCASSAASPAATSAKADSVLSAAAESNPNIDLGSSEGGVPAPGFRLVNQFGQAMSLSQFRGKVAHSPAARRRRRSASTRALGSSGGRGTCPASWPPER